MHFGDINKSDSDIMEVLANYICFLGFDNRIEDVILGAVT
jgi:hypothetical protein